MTMVWGNLIQQVQFGQKRNPFNFVFICKNDPGKSYSSGDFISSNLCMC